MLEIVVLIVFLSLVFDYTNGFHDAANVVSTVIATKALKPLTAILMAGVLNALGALLISGVAETIAQGLVEAEKTSQLVVLSAVSGAIFWNLSTWYWGIPSSSSYALIGGLLGAALLEDGSSTLIWSGVVYKVIFPMIISPLLGFLIAFFFMKGLYLYLGKRPSAADRAVFKHLQVLSACFVAFSHGLNDAQKSMGIITLGLFASGHLATIEIPLWVILSCALVMGLGTASGGFRIIRTMGYAITKIEPAQGFAAECAASGIILTASFLGMPISSTQMIAGSITGVGSAKSLSSVRWGTPRRMAIAWILTLPGAGTVGAVVYSVAKLAGLQ